MPIKRKLFLFFLVLGMSFADFIRFFQAGYRYYRRHVPEWTKSLVLWLINAFVASFVLLHWSNFATYMYAIRYGARPPVEGVPFLAFTVTLIGIALLIITLLLFQAVPLVLHSTKFMLTKTFNIRSWSKQTLLIVERIQSLFMIVGMIGIATYFTLDFISKINYFSLVIIYIYIVLIIASFFSTLFHSNINRALSKANINRVSFFLYCLSIAVLMIAMLGTPFDHILRATKFGGGVIVDVELRDQANLKNQSLFLASANFITTFDPATRRFYELNREHIIRIKYAGVEGWYLPREKEYAEILGFGDLSGHETATGANSEAEAPDGTQ